MQYVIDHADDLAAVVGAAYILARTIVVLTPTDKDNYALEKAGAIIKALCVAFGLKANQGITK